MPAFHVEVEGSGPRLVLVHGSIVGPAAWAAQRALADRFTLVIPARPGYPPNPPLARIDFEVQARELAPLLEDGAHLCGFSYGGVIALLLAAAEPERVLSLTVIEPPAFAVARGVPAADQLSGYLQGLWAASGAEPLAFARVFAKAFGERGPVELPPDREQGVRALMAERGPWEAEVPVEALARASFPKLVCSGGGRPAFEAVCDALAERAGAERVVLRGARHAVQQDPRFNAVLLDFLGARSR